MSVTTFVLVHGSWCSSAVWAPIARELTLRGHRAVAVDLPRPCGMAGIGTAVAAVIAVGNPAEIGAIRLDWRTTDPAHLDVLQSALLADGTRDELLAYLHTPDADESLLIDDQATPIDPEMWGRVPHTYVRLTEDHAMPLALQDRFIAEADAATPDNPFEVRSVTSSHLGFQIHPSEIVKILDGLA